DNEGTNRFRPKARIRHVHVGSHSRDFRRPWAGTIDQRKQRLIQLSRRGKETEIRQARIDVCTVRREITSLAHQFGFRRPTLDERNRRRTPGRQFSRASQRIPAMESWVCDERFVSERTYCQNVPRLRRIVHTLDVTSCEVV